MSATIATLQALGTVKDNPIGLESNVTTPICEGMNIALASFQALYIQYQKHHFVVEGSEFAMLHDWFHNSAKEVQNHVHTLGERLNGLGGVPVASFSKLAELCCFTPEPDGVFSCRAMLEHDLAGEQALVSLIRRLAAQAESLGDRGTRYMYEEILLKTEERTYHNAHFLAQDSLTLGFVARSN